MPMMEKVRTLCVVCHLGEIPKGLDLDLIQCHNKRLLCTLSAGQGGGGILDPAIASTRLGKLFDMGCEDDESDRHFYVLRPLNKVPDEVATEKKGSTCSRQEVGGEDAGDPGPILEARRL